MSDSDSDEENVIRYGTPLEPIEEDEIPAKRKYQEPAEQYAVDGHGRRRFHGAFTGGFSAGFGNTVGTPEGWAPAAFKSSRREKAQLSSQRPEDFMDEEDRSEFGIAPKLVETRSEFSGQKRPRQKQYFDGTIPGVPVLEQLLRPVHETAAVRILRSMGWREGTGAGERLHKQQRKKETERRRVYGCSLPGQDDKPDDDSDSDSEFDYDTLFAPQDYEPYLLQRKDDRFGLGYSGLSRHSVLGSLASEYGQGSSTSHLQMRDKGKKVSIRGQAFGVGALEADDEDIYATEDMSHYDFALGGPSTLQAKKKQDGGPNVLEGFVRSSKPMASVTSYPPPALPRGFTPAAAGTRRSRFEPTTHKQRDQGLGRHELSPAARGALLGEEAPQPPEDLQSASTNPLSSTINPESTPRPDTTDPIAKLERSVNFVTPSSEANKELDFISIKDSGKELSMVFKPFASVPAKQTRYEQYLANKSSYLAASDAQTDKVAEWERSRELLEFEQAAKLYKPLTGVMGDRFTHASEPDDALNPLTAVAKSVSNRGQATAEQIAAAQRGVYGLLTRSQVSWRPETIVCKRFNVPELGRNDTKSKEDKPKVSYSVFSYLEGSVHDRDSFAKEQSKFSGSKSVSTEIAPRNEHNKTTSDDRSLDKSSNVTQSAEKSKDPIVSTRETNTGVNKRMTVAELFLKESEKNKEQGIEVTQTIEKFDKMDLYKSIFLSDSEEEEIKPSETTTEFNFEEFIEGPKNVERNNSPPRGIFANINFDEINSWRRNAEEGKNTDSKKTKETKEESKEKTEKEDSSVNKNNDNTTEETYGPKIPDNIKKKLEENSLDNFRPVFRSKSEIGKGELPKSTVVEIDSSSSDDSWVDAKEVKTKKLKKKKSKKHKKHKKSKHKKKDR